MRTERFDKYFDGMDSKGKHNIVAIGLNRGVVVSVGYNQYLKTHPRQKALAEAVGQPERQYLHAEIDCIIKSRQPIDTLFVMRRNGQGRYRNAKPCAICDLAVKQANIKTVLHT